MEVFPFWNNSRKSIYLLILYIVYSRIPESLYIFLYLPEQSQNLDSSYKMDLDFWDCFGRGKSHLNACISKDWFRYVWVILEVENHFTVK